MGEVVKSFDVDLNGKLWNLNATPKKLISAMVKRKETPEHVDLQPVQEQRNKTSNPSPSLSSNYSIFTKATQLNEIFFSSDNTKNNNNNTNRKDYKIEQVRPSEDPSVLLHMPEEGRLESQAISDFPLTILQNLYFVLISVGIVISIPFLNYEYFLPYHLFLTLFAQFSAIFTLHAFVNLYCRHVVYVKFSVSMAIFFLVFFVPALSLTIQTNQQFELHGKCYIYFGMLTLLLYYTTTIWKYRTYFIYVVFVIYTATVVFAEFFKNGEKIMDKT